MNRQLTMQAKKFNFKSSSQGFSLLELLIVIAIIIIMSAIAVGAFFQTRLYAPEDQALKTMEFLRNASQLAITRKTQMRVEFNYPEGGTGGPMMGIFVGATTNLFDKNYKALNLRVQFARPATISGPPNPPNYTEYTGSAPWVAYFNPDGTIVTTAAGTVPVNATFYFSTAEEGDKTACAVTLFGGNGALRLWRYGASCPNNSWCRR